VTDEETKVCLATAFGMGQFKTPIHEEIIKLFNLWDPKAMYYDSERV
jgi:hypothetical protein